MPTPAQLLKEINAGKFKPAYYFYGAEDYRIIEAAKYVARQFLPDRQIATNYRKLNGRKTSARDLINELANLPMLGERQVFNIAEFQSYKPTEVERILKMLNPPDPNRVIVFTSPSARMPKKKSKFLNTVSAAVEAVEFPRLTPGEVRAQVQGRLTKVNLQIEPKALTLLVEMLAGNLGAVVGEVDKLANYRQPGETITTDDVAGIVAGYEVFNIFELADLVAEGSASKVLHMLERLMLEGNSPVSLCTFIIQHFLRLYLIRNGKPLPGNFAWLERRLRPQASRYEPDRLEQILLELAETDAQLRGGDLPPKLALEILVISLVTSRQKAYG